MAVEPTVLDEIDSAILGALRRDGRISWHNLGQVVNLSANATAERVRRLQRLGVLTGFAAVVDPAALGRNVRARIDVTLGGEQQREAFEAALREHPDVLDAVHLTGDSDYELTVDCAGSAGLDRFLGWLKTTFAIARSSTRVVLRQVR